MFGLENYKNLIEILLENNYIFSANWNINPKSKTVLMRHDIDFSVEYALILADFEKSMNMCSTYFFMLSSNMYNLLSGVNKRRVREIVQMGHKVSLHFDPTVHKSLDGFLKEREVFQLTFGVQLDVVSIHRPGTFLENNNIELFGTRHTYQDYFFKELKYLSDSGGKDVRESISSFLVSENCRALQLLTHPIWWVNHASSQTSALNTWRTKNLDFVTNEIRKNCVTYED